jgi:hypothetical protein
MEIQSTEFELTGRDQWNNRIGTVTVHPFRLHTRRYPNVLEFAYRQWQASGYDERDIPAAMTSFLAWKRGL